MEKKEIKSSHQKEQPCKTSLFDFYDLILYGVIVGHVLINPFTKVEETLHTNGMYDHLYLMTDIQNYDHQEFPGVVTRSFICSIIVSATAYPFNFILRNYLGFTCLASLYLVRIILGTYMFLSLKFIRKCIDVKYKNKDVS